ncbi:MAG: tetratricopeptide repeat protein [Chloroflexota bacterium]
MSIGTNDTILLEMSQIEFEKMIGEVLKLAREGDLLALSTTPLSHGSLVNDCFLLGEPISSDARGRAIQSLLAWAVERLRPIGEHSWLANAWRSYNILQAFYIKGTRASELAEQMAISEQTLYQSRPQAIASVAQILREETASPTDKQNRQRHALADRYATHTAEEQKLLRIVSVFTGSLPVSLLHDLHRKITNFNDDLLDPQASIHQLIGRNLLVGNEAGTEVALRPEMRAFLRTLLAPDERGQLHNAAAEHYLQQQEYLESARQLRVAGDYERAAQILIDYQRKLFDNLQIEELAEIVGEFQPTEVSLDVWARLKIVSGEIAEFSKEIDLALGEYQQALAAPDIQIKALAYYRRARAFERQNVGESLAHYGYAIQLVQDLIKSTSLIGNDTNANIQTGKQEELSNLLAEMHIGRAWIYIQMQPNSQKAAADLRSSEDLTDEHNRIAWADLHNAYGSFYENESNLEQATQHYRQAWLAANEMRDLARMTNTAHNLGGTLSEQGDFEQALHYLTQSLDLSSKSNNRQMEGLCHLSIGACHFWQDQFVDAIRDYHAARQIFEETGNHTLQLRAYFNLAEAYAELTDLPQARHYFEHGYSKAQTLKDEGSIRDFLTLAETYPTLMDSPSTDYLNDRQQQALLHIQTHGQITNRGYQELTQVSQKQAVRDLNEMIVLGVIERRGKGRSTHYVYGQ